MKFATRLLFDVDNAVGGSGVIHWEIEMRNLQVLAAAVVAAMAIEVCAKDIEGQEYFAMSLAPDVSSWTKVAEGFYEGKGEAGDLVRVYLDTEGAKLVLADLQKERESVLDQIRVAERNGSIAAKSANDQLASAVKLLGQLDQQIVFAREVANQPVSAEKAHQIFDATTGTLCGYNNQGIATFYATGLAGNWPQAYAEMDYWGSAGVIGPPAPIPYVLRQVTAKVTVGSTYDSDYLWSYALTGMITATATYQTPTGACQMQTMHAAQARCMAGDPWSYYKLFREQTCSGVVADTPPTTHP